MIKDYGVAWAPTKGLSEARTRLLGYITIHRGLGLTESINLAATLTHETEGITGHYQHIRLTQEELEESTGSKPNLTP